MVGTPHDLAVLHTFVNGQEVRTTEFEPHETLLDFLRGEQAGPEALCEPGDLRSRGPSCLVNPGRGLTGTKLGCGEGGCGAW